MTRLSAYSPSAGAHPLGQGQKASLSRRENGSVEVTRGRGLCSKVPVQPNAKGAAQEGVELAQAGGCGHRTLDCAWYTGGGGLATRQCHRGARSQGGDVAISARPPGTTTPQLDRAGEAAKGAADFWIYIN